MALTSTVGPFRFKLARAITLTPPDFSTWPLLCEEGGEVVSAAREGADTYLVIDHRSPEGPRVARVEFWAAEVSGEGTLRGMFVLSDPVMDVCRPSERWTLGSMAELLGGPPSDGWNQARG